MTFVNPQSQVLIIEPNDDLVNPYAFFDAQVFNCQRVRSLPSAKQQLKTFNYDLICLSMTFSAQSNLEMLTAIKDSLRDQITPLLFVIDLNQALSIVPGTHWGQKLAILHSDSDKTEFDTSMKQLLKM
ncbi:MAG: hypothetical protein ACOZAN_01235 [Patescibacteria group bacterium]